MAQLWRPGSVDISLDAVDLKKLTFNFVIAHLPIAKLELEEVKLDLKAMVVAKKTGANWMELQSPLQKTDPPVKHQKRCLQKCPLQPKAVAEAPLAQRKRGSTPPVPEGISTQSGWAFCINSTREVLMHIGKRHLLPWGFLEVEIVLVLEMVEQ
ncbi:hypothetical protein C0995_012076 [Termitomyces sp. Mi166|nr:hypothetical protein C0995_012076 [Termitomyces sp. Mi166\